MSDQPSAACRACLARLSRYPDGGLREADCRRLEEHLRTCAACSRAVSDRARLVAACRAARTTPLPASVRRRAAKRVADLLAQGAAPAARNRVARRRTK